jgi:hypothetical protein
MGAIDFNQQVQILRGVLGRKPPPRAFAHANLSALAVAPDQARDLRQAQARHLGQPRAHRAALLLF